MEVIALKMKRTQMYLTQVDMAKIKALADKEQISVSELVRRIIDDYLKKIGDK